MVSELSDIAGVLSAAPSLEPLAAAALVIDLAYLGLERFRYRGQIRYAAESQRKIFETPGRELPNNIKQMKYYVQLCALCDLPNNDIVEAPQHRKDARIGGSIWGWLYHTIYSQHFDRGLTLTFAALAGLTLSAGVAHELGTWGWLDGLYAPWLGAFWMYVLLAGATIPIVFVYVGRLIVHYVSEHATECRVEIEKAMQTGTQGAQLPVVIEPTSQSAANVQ